MASVSSQNNYGTLETMHHSTQLTRLGSASFISCVANLSNTILGTGMLAMAHGFAQGGLFVGMVTVILCGSMAYLGLYLLALCAAHPAIPHRTASFSAISKLTYPKASILFDLAIAIKCFGVSISYLLIFGKLIPQVILSFQTKSSILELEETTHWALDRRLWITLSMVILGPVSFLPTLDSLRHISYVALIGVVNLVYVVIYKFIFDRPLPSSNSGAQIRWFKLDSGFLTALPLFVFAYTCAQNLFSVHNEMILNSSREMKSVLRTCIGSAVGTYEIVGILGYLTFGSKVSSNLIADYQNSILVSITRFTVSILVLFSYPLQLYPCRTSLIKVFNHHFNQNKPLPSRSTTRESQDEEEDHENENLIHHSSTLHDDNDNDVDNLLDQDLNYIQHSDKLFVSITIFLLITSFLIAVQVERLEIILGFVGSTGSTTISYILPGLFFLKLFPEVESSSPEENREEVNHHKSTTTSIQDLCINNSNNSNSRSLEERESQLNPQQQHTAIIIGQNQNQLTGFQIKLLRKFALLLVFIGCFIMIVCLSLNIHDAFFS